MVVKYVDEKASNNKFIKAGLVAEKQMAHYLDRAFQKTEEIFIINDLRIKEGSDVAQMDHLVIHQYGFIIIESKSVSSKISVNEHGEWKRIFNNKEQGMSSPVQQAKRQATFLKEFLEQRSSNLFRDNLANKLFKRSFDNYSFDILIAISDNGIIERNNNNLLEVFKADTIPDKISDLISNREKDFIKGLFNPFSSECGFHTETIKKIGNTLLSLHEPMSKTIKKVKSVQKKNITYTKPKPSSITYSCSKCKSDNIKIKYGRYSYYFTCLACEGTTSIKHTCNTPSCKPKTKKKKLQFFKVCEACDIDDFFWENKS